MLRLILDRVEIYWTVFYLFISWNLFLLFKVQWISEYFLSYISVKDSYVRVYSEWVVMDSQPGVIL
jgi:hypothetical protein